MKQEQFGGDGTANNQAGRDVNVHHHHYGVTEERAREIALELWQNNAPRLASEARGTFDGRAIKMTTEIITKTVAEDPELLERFKDPRAQVVLLKAQEAYGETGDDELGAILAGLVVALVGEPTRTRQEIVLREAIECAPRLSAQHLSALIVIVLLTRMSYRATPSVEALLDSLDGDLAPYYGAIPTDAFEYTYMGATAAGLFLPGLGHKVYDKIFSSHPNAMYPPIPPDEIPEDWTATAEAGAELSDMLYAQHAEAIENVRLRIRPDAADVVLRADPQAPPPLTPLQTKLREFVMERSIMKSDFAALLREAKPELAAFLDTIDSTMALHFQPSAVGIMLARHAVATRSPHAAEQIDRLFAAVGSSS